MNKVRVPFEGRDLFLDLPETWRVELELKPNPIPKLNDIPKALTRGLKNPIGCEGLGTKDLSNKKIVIVVDDITRPTPAHLFFQNLLKYLYNHGTQRGDILVIVALGVHRDMTGDEVRQKLGIQDVEKVKWINHDCRDIKEHVKLGTTKRGTTVILNRHLKDADLILCVGTIEPHPLLGFGGGLKMILPGLAHQRTIAQNHMQGVSPERFNYIGVSDSPMRLDLEEGVQMLNKNIFIVNTILNQDMEICRFVCGNPIKAYREGVRIVESINGMNVTEPADVAIVASNPMNADLRQGIKCIANIEGSVKENGLIMAFLECRYGIGDIAVSPRRLSLSNGLLRFILKTVGRKRILWLVDRFKKDTGIEERFLLHFSMQIARKNQIFVYSNNLPQGTDKKLGLFRQFNSLDKILKEAARYAPKRARVYIYPYGGVTYPVAD